MALKDQKWTGEDEGCIELKRLYSIDPLNSFDKEALVKWVYEELRQMRSEIAQLKELLGKDKE